MGSPYLGGFFKLTTCPPGEGLGTVAVGAVLVVSVGGVVLVVPLPTAWAHTSPIRPPGQECE